MSTKPRPGEFREGPCTEVVSPTEPKPSSHKPNSSESLADSYRLLATTMAQQPKTILYPCCEADVTPSAAFPNAQVQYVDMNREAMKELIAHGYDAHVGRVPTGRTEGQSSSDSSDVPQFKPKDPVDLLILLNPQIGPFEIAKEIRHRGYLICNNYHGTADEMHTHSDFAPVAMLHTGEEKKLVTSSLDDCFTLLSTDDEYKQADPKKYKIIQRYIYGRFRTLFPGVFDVSKAIPKFLERARGKHEMFDSVFIGKDTLPKPLRKKPTSVDDLFLFQRQK